MNNKFLLLPHDVIMTISGYVDPQTKKDFLLVDRRTSAIALDAIKSISIFPKDSHLPTSKDTLVQIFCRPHKLSSVSFIPRKIARTGGENFTTFFGHHNISCLESLASYFENHRDKHPLGSVKKVLYKEMIKNIGCEPSFLEKIRDVTSLLLRSISHKNLEKVEIQDLGYVQETEFQPILDCAPDLKIFSFYGHPARSTPVSLSFANQPHLRKAKLVCWEGPDSTIASLKDSKGLEGLTLLHKSPCGRFMQENAIGRIAV